MPWLINEDRAVKAKFQGLTVTDANAPSGGRPVVVRYRMPESELATQTFPMIVIEHAGVDKADDREHRGSTIIPYAPEGTSIWWDTSVPYFNVADSPYVAEFPIPYNIRFRILVYAREAWHDIQLASVLAGFDYVPARFGFLDVPENHTVRCLDLLGSAEVTDVRDENGKRLFCREYLISVSSELLPSVVTTYVQAQSVALSMTYYMDDVTGPPAA